MKSFLFILLLVLSLSLTFSATIEMEDEFYLGDNAIVKVSANFDEPIRLADIDFYRRHMMTSFEDVKTIKIGNEQFITFKVPMNKPSPDNYSINTTVKENFMQQVQENEVSSKFKILNETGSFYLEEAFFVSTENYSIPVQSLVGQEIVISISSSLDEDSSESFLSSLFGKDSSKSEIVLGPYERKFIDFEIGNESRLVRINLNKENESQSVLVYEDVLINENEEEPQETNVTENSSLDNQTNESIEDPLENESQIIVENESVEVYIEEKNESTEFEPENSSEDNSENETLNETETNQTEGNETEESSLKTCAEMAGKICNPENETCEGIVKDAKDGVCCVGTCIEKETSSAGKWIGWALLAVVLFSVGYALWKNKGKKGKGLELSKKKK